VRLNRHWLGQGGMQNFAGLVRGVLATLAALALGAGSLAYAQNRIQTSVQGKAENPSGPKMKQVRAAYAQLPLIFEQNQGQSDPQVKFLAHGQGYGLFLTQKAAVLTLQQASRGKSQQAVLSMSLDGSNNPGAVEGTDRLPGTSNYFIGNDPKQWYTRVPQFARVNYAGVYPGIDLAYYGNQGQLEYDFFVAPHADAAQIKLHFGGADHIQLASDGTLVLNANGSQLRLQAPRIYQTFGARRIPVAGHYAMLAGNSVGIALANYDHSRELVIDPILTYSTFLGGTGSEACSAISGSGTPISNCPGITVDSISNVYIAGTTTSADFPNPTAPPALTGTANVFIAKLNINASGAAQLVTSIFLGGNGTDLPAGIAIDSGFNVIVTGTTSSTNFPVINAYQSAPASAGSHVFVSKFDLTADTLRYSTYLSGNGQDAARGLALDGGGNIYILGATTSTDVPSLTDVFPSTLGSFQDASRGASQFFFTKINPTSSGVNSISYSSYFGGGNPTNGKTLGGGIALDTAGNIYITGGTNFLNTQNNPDTDFPILNPFQVCLDTPVNPTSGTCSVALTATDAFVAKFSPVTGSTNQFTLNYSSYLGGTGDDVGYGVAADTASDTYLTGSTTSNDFVLPTATVSFQSANQGGTDAFVAKVAPFLLVLNTTATQASALDYFSYLGGSGTDVGLAITADNIGGAYVAGYTNSPNFPTNNGTFTALAGANDGFAVRVDTTASTATTPSEFMTYLGGAGNDAATSIVLDNLGGTVIGGETFSSNFPTANPFQGSLAGTSDAFITRLGPVVTLSMVGSPSPSPVGVGNQVTFTYTITNSGDAVQGLIFTDTPQGGNINSPITGSTTSGGTCSTGSVIGLTCTIGAIAGSGGTATVTVLMTPTVGTGAGALGNSATVTAIGCGTQQCPSTSAQSSVGVTDFSVLSAPTSVTTPAGQPATYQVTVTPNPNTVFPESVTLACSSSLPSGATCSFTNNPITSLTGSQTRSLVINTTARTTTISQEFRMKNFYAMFLPLSGLVIVGACFAGPGSRKRRLMAVLFVIGVFGGVFTQAGCGNSGSITTVAGTPAGTYNVTLTATSGSAQRTTVITLVVQ
jgi:hypothetical protein